MRAAKPGLALNAIILFMGLLILAGCASVPTDPEERAEFEQTNDPLEPMNRKIFAFNMFLDQYLMEPIARGYRAVLPDAVQRGIHNMLGNLREPYVAGNEVLQGHVGKATDDLGRFLLNTVWGPLGMRDVVADNGGPKANDSDIGLTLGTWGVGEGPFLMLPFFGPSNPRDAAGRVADWWADPADATFGAVNANWMVGTRFAFDTVDTRVQFLDPLDDLKRSSLDLYASLRSLYRQQRESALGGGVAAQSAPGTVSMP